jgi:hypothetical protein
MTTQLILYIKAGLTPDWKRIRVIHLPSREILSDVMEADASEGWILRRVRDRNGLLVLDENGHLATERVECEIRIERVPG